MKECSTCKELLSIDNFYKSRNQCKNCRRLQKQEYRSMNVDKVKLYRKRYIDSSKGRDKHLKYRRKNRRYIKAMERANKFGVVPKWARRDKIKTVYDKANWLESITGIKYHVDHIVPLNGENVCGLHVWENLQILEVSLNCKKGNKLR